MAVNFRKRVKIAPGVRLNLSKSGISLTTGIRGASVTTGKNGIYANTGLPGTGIYQRKKIGGKSDSATQPKDASYTVDDSNIGAAQKLIADLNAQFDAIGIREKNIVIIASTLPFYLFGIVKNILNSMGIRSGVTIKRSTNCVLIGDKKEMSKLNYQQIATLNLQGAGISVFRISTTPSESGVLIEPIAIDMAMIKASKGNSTLRKVAIILFSIVAFLLAIVILSVIFAE